MLRFVTANPYYLIPSLPSIPWSWNNCIVYLALLVRRHLHRIRIYAINAWRHGSEEFGGFLLTLWRPKEWYNRHAPLVRQSTTHHSFHYTAALFCSILSRILRSMKCERRNRNLAYLLLRLYYIDFIPPPPNYWLTSSSPPSPSRPPLHPLPITLGSWIAVSSFNGRNNSLNWISLAPKWLPTANYSL